MDPRTGRTGDDLTPPTKAKLDPVDPSLKTAVAADMEGRRSVLICCPLAIEYECVRGELKENAQASVLRWRRTARSHRESAFSVSERLVLLVQTGLGANSAAAAANLIVDYDPEKVCLLGFAGALDPSLNVGDTVEGGLVWSAETGELVVPAPLGIAGRMAQMLSVGNIVESPEAKAELLARHGCAAVEMEAFGIGKVCEAHRRVFVTARAISDAADETFPKELNSVIRPSGELSKMRLAGALLKKPTLIGPLFRLWNKSKKAKEGLRLITRRLVEGLV